jgi:hypothetical protein
MAAAIDSSAYTHRSLISLLSVTNPEGLDLSVTSSAGIFTVNTGSTSAALPIDEGAARKLISRQCPNLSPRFISLLVSLLSHPSWRNNCNKATLLR